MKCKDDIITYNNEEKRALNAINEFGLQRKLYYKKRNLGMSAQEAFEHCIKVNEKQKKHVNVQKIAADHDVSAKAIYTGFHKEQNIDEIIMNYQIKKRKDEEMKFRLQEQGMPVEFNCLFEFCIKEKLNYDSVYKNIQKGMSLYDAVSSSFERKQVFKKYVCFGIQLKSLCQENGLDYDSVSRIYRDSKDYQYAFERAIFNQSFMRALGKKNEYYWNIYKNEFLTGNSKDTLDEEKLNHFTEICYRTLKLNRKLNYYQFLSNMNISELMNYPLDERVRMVLLSIHNIPFSLNELYFILDFENGLMKNFSYWIEKDKRIWIFDGNKEVLRKIKRPSN